MRYYIKRQFFCEIKITFGYAVRKSRKIDRYKDKISLLGAAMIEIWYLSVRAIKMAESCETTEQNLPETFKEIWKVYDILEKTEEPTGSDKVQVEMVLK